MKSRNFVAVALFAGVATLASPVAFAGDSNAYAALDIGRSHMKDGCTGVPATMTCDDTDTAYRLAGGYQFTPMWGMEVGYADLGKTSMGGTYLGAAVTLDAKASSLQLAATGTFPVSDAFSVIGKLGIARNELKVSATAAIAGVNAAASATENKTKATYGIGVQYDFSKSISARAQYEDFGTFGDDATTGTSKVTLLSAGVVFKF